MSNIVVSEAAQWTEAEAQRNFKTLEDMGMTHELETAKKLRQRGKAEDNPQPRPAGETDTQETSKKGKN